MFFFYIIFVELVMINTIHIYSAENVLLIYFFRTIHIENSEMFGKYCTILFNDIVPYIKVIEED